MIAGNGALPSPNARIPCTAPAVRCATRLSYPSGPSQANFALHDFTATLMPQQQQFDAGRNELPDQFMSRY
ncbi:MAG: hypothetical protein F4X14_05720 [Caldilineaceae bacterium SB0661_bin_32]|uniref:Uncharacterized protein n=1 Tax=Caldilineaceae bacterium SB0661_bin_32 TaxID=2605255 RepID=A0A6B1D3P3_9CHLR|nr:hypothetical protein [Caldilineaceae bacterium SB0661_bin_32]